MNAQQQAIADALDANNTKIDALTTQVGKVGREIQTLLEGQNLPAEIMAKITEQTGKLVTLGTAVQSADDLNEDGTPVEPEPEPEPEPEAGRAFDPNR